MATTEKEKKAMRRLIHIRPDEVFSVDRLAMLWGRDADAHFRRKFFREADEFDDGRVPMKKVAGVWMVHGADFIAAMFGREEETPQS